MKINWKLRFQNKVTLTALIAQIIAVVYFACEMFGIELPIPQDSWITLAGLIIAVLVTLGVVVDPTTQNASDSDQALNYDKPKGE